MEPLILAVLPKVPHLSLHAKVSMYQQKWQQVYDLTTQVIASGQYTLFANYEQFFRIKNENSSESIFEIQNELVLENKDASNSQYSQVQGVRGVVGGGWGFNVPTQELADAVMKRAIQEEMQPLFSVVKQHRTVMSFLTVGDNPMYNQKSYVPFQYCMFPDLMKERSKMYV